MPGTTTPKATYTTDALSVMNANPVISDSAGRFPQMFADEGEVFDLLLTDSLGGNQRTFSAIASLGGAASGDIIRDFGLNGRFQVYGEAGVIQIETGDPTGDDVGGSGRIGGWDGTQGDNLELDYAQTTVTGAMEVTGPLTATGVSDFQQLLSSGAVPSAASFDIALPSAYDCYLLVMENVSGTTTTPLARFSFDNGSSYKAAAGDYVGATKNIGGTTVNSSSNSTDIVLAVANNALYSHYALNIYSKATKETSLGGLVTTVISGNADVSWPAGSTNAKNFGKATNIRILTAAGTFTGGRYALFGIPGV